jgi:hypothetical protein
MNEKYLRKKLLRWHYDLLRPPSLRWVELLSSDFQRFRYMVQARVGKELNYKEAIKVATENELWELQAIIDEDRAERRLRGRR